MNQVCFLEEIFKYIFDVFIQGAYKAIFPLSYPFLLFSCLLHVIENVLLKIFLVIFIIAKVVAIYCVTLYVLLSRGECKCKMHGCSQFLFCMIALL